MSVQHISQLLEFCLNNTYVFFQGQYYEQREGTAIGSPVSPIVANIYMESLKTIHSTQMTIQQECGRDMWMTLLLSRTLNTRTRFLQGHTVHSKDTRPDGAIPFLDIIIIPTPVGTLTTGIYRKPTHRDQYLQWDSHNHISLKYVVINIFSHRAKIVCPTPELLGKEVHHLQEALSKCKYPR